MGIEPNALALGQALPWGRSTAIERTALPPPIAMSWSILSAMARSFAIVFVDATDTLIRVRGTVGAIYAEAAARFGLAAPAADLVKPLVDGLHHFQIDSGIRRHNSQEPLAVTQVTVWDHLLTFSLAQLVQNVPPGDNRQPGA